MATSTADIQRLLELALLRLVEIKEEVRTKQTGQ